MDLLHTDQTGGRRGIGFRVQMPVHDQHHLMDRDTTPAFGHARRARIGRVGKDRGHQRRLIARRCTAAIMGESVEKPGPVVNFGEQAGDPGPGNED